MKKNNDKRDSNIPPTTGNRTASSSSSGVVASGGSARAGEQGGTSLASPEEIKQLKMQINQLRTEMANLKSEVKTLRDTNAKVTVEKAKATAALETSSKSIKDLEATYSRQLEETKRKQWCAACLKEAIYFCCWNTSYCGYDCQSKHWPQHMPSCQQANRQQQASSVKAEPQRVNSNQTGDKK